MNTCISCGCELAEEEEYISEQGDIYCESCYDEEVYNQDDIDEKEDSDDV